MELGLAFVIGIASAMAYSLIQGIYDYFRWRKTKRYFTSGIYGEIVSITYHVSMILDIDLVRFEYGEEVMREDEVFMEEVNYAVITGNQYRILNLMLQNTREKIQNLRKEALSIPIFVAADFHSADSFLMVLNSFISVYSWIEDDDIDEKTDHMLKEKLSKILECSKKNPFRENLLDNLWKWYNRNYFFIKNRVNKKPKRYGDIDQDSLPF